LLECNGQIYFRGERRCICPFTSKASAGVKIQIGATKRDECGARKIPQDPGHDGFGKILRMNKTGTGLSDSYWPGNPAETKIGDRLLERIHVQIELALHVWEKGW
jgi:hypothetical protein